MDLICSSSNIDPIDLYRVGRSGILTVQEAVQTKMVMIYWVSQKIYPILKLNFEVVNISMRKMIVSPDSGKMYKSIWYLICLFLCPAAIPMTSSSCDIYFHTSSGNQTKLEPVEKYWLESFVMSMPSPFLINSFSSFYAYYLSSLLLLTSSVFGRLTARNCPQRSQN